MSTNIKPTTSRYWVDTTKRSRYPKRLFKKTVTYEVRDEAIEHFRKLNQGRLPQYVYEKERSADDQRQQSNR